MRITVLGAAGKTGVAVVDQALEQGHQVTAFVRDPAKITRRPAGLTVVTGDAREATDLGKALAGSDAVISTLGTMSSKDELIDRSTAALVSAATEVHVRRLVIMSSYLASDQYRPNFLGRVIGAAMKGMVADKSAGEKRLVTSGLDWTIVYPTTLDKAPAGTPVRVVPPGETVSMSNGIAREDVARFLLVTAATDTHLRQKVVITGK